LLGGDHQVCADLGTATGAAVACLCCFTLALRAQHFLRKQQHLRQGSHVQVVKRCAALLLQAAFASTGIFVLCQLLVFPHVHTCWCMVLLLLDAVQH
jgi:hypothetical protein